MKKPFKTTLIAIAASIGLVLAALAMLVLKDRVAKLVRSELNERFDAAVDFEAIDLSLLSTFPTLTVEVVDLSIAGKGVFEGTTLLSVQSLGAGVDLFSLIGDDELVVESIAIEHPEIHVVVTEDGVANYDIVKESAEESEELEPEEEVDTADIVLQLRHYRIIDGTITYEAPGTHVLIDELHHDGSATITGAAQTLASKTTIGELSVKLGRVTYLKKAKKVEVAIATTLRTDARHIDLEQLSIAVNELSVAGSGDIGWTDDALDLDVEVASAKGQSLKALVSAVPNAYAADFAGLRASGSFSLDAKVKGQLGPDDDDIPSFSVRLLVHDGTLKYPDLPLPLTNVALDAKATHPGGNLDKVRIDVAKYAARAGESHASGRLAVTTPISQPDVALALEGRFDMAEIADAYPIPDVEDLRGVITATLDLAAKGDDIKRLRGDIRATDIVYRAKDAPPVKVEEAHVVLSPRATKVEAFRANLGRSDVALSGSLSPFTAFLSVSERRRNHRGKSATEVPGDLRRRFPFGGGGQTDRSRDDAVPAPRPRQREARYRRREADVRRARAFELQGDRACPSP
ncbi:MAG: AsmA family protein [Deltaproteobacteria bacterium]|nr:AsmA family protein [Deltaproteobacteria bacterium]